jgi:hypothetical protein
MIEPAKNWQLESQFFEFFKFCFWENWLGFLNPCLVKWVYTRADIQEVSVADTNNLTAPHWAGARKQRPIHVASQQVMILFPVS